MTKGMGLDPDYWHGLFVRHAGFYVFLQVLIWVKVFFFFSAFGKGIMVPDSSFFEVLRNGGFAAIPFALSWVSFDFWFHEFLHVLIALNVFVFARSAGSVSLVRLLGVFLVASVLHNVGYWVTNVFVSPGLLVADFVTDVLLLFLFYFLFRWVCGHSARVEGLRFPLVD
ncbi:MAG: hypothetical protein HY917_04595 [Candidatus Diapherotrites archaeon]|nr:hypothetical protein [Candidatus Diapherotrites archaeon]